MRGVACRGRRRNSIAKLLHGNVLTIAVPSGTRFAMWLASGHCPPFADEGSMSIALTTATVLAPERLVAETRVDFRSNALDCLARESEAGGEGHSLTIDLGGTRDIDASGLGILVLVQKRARERGLPTRLVNTPNQVRSLLSVTKLDGLFELA
jgi:anti-anti-sigma regulatory factor